MKICHTLPKVSNIVAMWTYSISNGLNEQAFVAAFHVSNIIRKFIPNRFSCTDPLDKCVAVL